MYKQTKFVNKYPLDQVRSLLVFIVDTSSSVEASGLMYEMQLAVEKFLKKVSEDIDFQDIIEIAVIEFNSEVRVLQNPALAKEVTMKKFNPGGCSKLAEGIVTGLALVNQRAGEYYSNNASINVFLFTDGDSDEMNKLNIVKERIHEDVSKGKYVFVPVGLGKVNNEVLQDLVKATKPIPVIKDKASLDDFFNALYVVLRMSL